MAIDHGSIVTFGYTADAALSYVKGGFAWANNELSFSGGGVTASDTKLRSGYTIGGGFGYMFAPAWSAKAEYMYADFGHQNYFANLVPPPGGELGTTVHTIKGGINYHFNWGGPVVARY